MNKEIEFNEQDLIASLQEASAHAAGKRTLRTTTIPGKAPAIRGEEILQIRRKLNASRGVFAALLNVNEDTVKSWEKSRRAPTGAALRLLQIAHLHPEALSFAE